ncbi:8421_t:CDS:10 [Entrophospora sp. SA101]|nr:8421_t:CDS:10 [Entrophospora sp. SA101]
MFRCLSLISQIASSSLKGRSAIINAALIDPTKAEATEATTMLSRGFSISILRQATVSLKESGKSSVNKSDESPEPKKPRSPYVIFLSDEYKSERTKNPELKKLGDISKVLAERWKNLSKDQKSSYEARFQQGKNEYRKKYEEWQNSLTLEDIELENQHRGLKNKKLLRDPNLPKKPVTSYIHFVKQNLNVNDGESSTSRLSKLAEKWKSLSEEETEPYKNLAEKDKERYIVRKIETDFDIPVTKYKSSVTGLTAINVKAEVPLVYGYFSVATEAFDDDGCPHTLEQWTGVDNTSYTITTAGSEGFLNMLPIYVDHVLYPTLTDSGYYTEGSQNSGESLTQRRFQRLMYPEGCGYRYETGGLMECLRKLGYHRDYYRPDNLCLLLIGNVEEDKLLKTLDIADGRIAKKGPLPPHKRPFVDSPKPPPLKKTIKEILEFPEDDESMGHVSILWKDINTMISDQITTTIQAMFSNVPTKELETVSTKIFELYNRVVHKDGIDMERMNTLIKRIKLQNLEIYDQLLKFDQKNWIELLKKYYLDNPSIILLGKPSAKFAEKLSKDEEERVEKQRKDLGPENLKKLKEKLEEAKRKNDVPVPKEVMEKIPTPNVDNISFIKVLTGRNKPYGKFNNTVQSHLDKDNSVDLPYFTQFDLYLSTSTIPSHLRPYIEIYLESIFGLPLNNPITGVRLDHEQVITELNKDTIAYDSAMGERRGFDQIISIKLQLEANIFIASKYQKGIQWLRDILWYTEFSAERENSNKFISDVLFQEKFLPKVISELSKNPEKVIKDFYEFRKILTSPENMRIHVIGNILKLDKPISSWVKNFKIVEFNKQLGSIPLAKTVLTEYGKNPGNKGYIVKLPTIEGSYSYHVTKGPDTFDSPDYPPLLVLCEILQTMEGIFWKLIRGQGLAYGTRLKIDPESAFNEARKVIVKLAEKKMEYDVTGFEGARSSLIYSLVRNESSLVEAARSSFINQSLKNMSADYNKELIKKVQAVKIEELNGLMKKYLLNLFKPETSIVIVVSTSNKDIKKGFGESGFNLEEKTLDKII